MINLRPIALLPLLPFFVQFTYPPEIPDTEAVTYKSTGQVKLKLWVTKPEGWKAGDRRPAVVFFFGGGWKKGSPEQFAQQCKRLAGRGMVAMTADYRVRSRHGVLAKDCVADARDAVRWIRAHAAELGVEPNRLAAGGGSAGGHIAACLGTIQPEGGEEVSSRPNALLLFNPACVIAKIDGKHPWGEDRSEEMRERMGVAPEKLSPAHHASAKSAPCAIFHGKSDSTVPFSTAETFAAKMKEAGARCELFGYEGEGHGFFNFGRDENKAFEATMADAEQFLANLGWLEDS